MFSSLTQIESYLQELVPKSSQMLFSGELGITRTKEYLKLLGSPQNSLKIVHVAGTSGKGSTSFMISNLLESQGFKVGLHLSPHLIDVRERMLINNVFISESSFISYFNEIVPAIETMKHTKWGALTYFEAMVGFVFFIFAKEKLKYAVIETGLGGEFDGTNIVDRADKLSVITKIGFDHTKILGNTLSKIAHQKAMICVPKGTLISTKQTPSAQKEIERVVLGKKGRLILVDEQDISSQFGNYKLGMAGEYQKENAVLALSTLSYLSKRDSFKLDVKKAVSKLASLRFKGRFDVVAKTGGITILDGAHNVQKMKALLNSVLKQYPDKKFTFVLAFKAGKDYKKMLGMISPYAEKIIITHIFSKHQDLLHESVPPIEIKKELKKITNVHTSIVLDREELIKIIKKENSSVIVTGSLYLLGDLYRLL